MKVIVGVHKKNRNKKGPDFSEPSKNINFDFIS